MPRDARQRIFNQLKIVQKLDKQYMVEVIAGWESPETDTLTLITEKLSYTLREYLDRHQSAIYVNVALQWAKSILQGLAYLQGLSPPVVYQTLSPDTLFISATSGKIKFGNVGLSSSDFAEGVADSSQLLFQFGLCLLEICLQTDPSQDPDSHLSRVQEPDLHEFLSLCLAPQPLRATIPQLLAHRVFVSLGELCRPLRLLPAVPRRHRVKSVGIKPSDESEDLLAVHLTVEDELQRQREVVFEFNCLSEVPEQLAEDLVNELELEEKDVLTILQAIGAKYKVVTLKAAVGREAAVQIRFTFRVGIDTPEQVAGNLVAALDLADSERPRLSALVREKLNQ